jgi:hypothetical protein
MRYPFHSRDAVRGFDVFLPMDAIQTGNYFFDTKQTIVLRVELWCYGRLKRDYNNYSRNTQPQIIRPPKGLRYGRYLNRESNDFYDLTQIPKLEPQDDKEEQKNTEMLDFEN